MDWRSSIALRMFCHRDLLKSSLFVFVLVISLFLLFFSENILSVLFLVSWKWHFALNIDIL